MSEIKMPSALRPVDSYTSNATTPAPMKAKKAATLASWLHDAVAKRETLAWNVIGEAANEIDALTARIAELERESEKMKTTYLQPSHGWVCFHCGETFTKPGEARYHFGETPHGAPGCVIKVGEERGLLMALRKAEAELAAARKPPEDVEVLRATNPTRLQRKAYGEVAVHVRNALAALSEVTP